MRFLATLAVALTMTASTALAQSARMRVFTTSHDFIGSADLSGGVSVVPPGADTPRPALERLSSDDSSLRLPRTTRAIASPDLVRADVTVDSSGVDSFGVKYTTAPITNGSPPLSGDSPGLVWRSEDVPLQHFVDLEFHDVPRDVSSLSVVWGSAGGPAHWKIQVADANGWLTDTIGWMDATGDPSSLVTFVAPISTRRIRIVQDEGGGPAGEPNVLTVAELSIATAGAPVSHPVSVDSSYLDYAPSFIADGDTRVGTTANFWTEVWVSANDANPHWVEVDLVGPRLVSQADIYWGHWGSARFKVQYWTGSAFVDTSTSAGTWLDGGAGHAVSHVQFAPVTTTRMRVLQDADGGIPPPEEIQNPRPGLMSVAELELHSAQSWLLSGSADSIYPGYSPSALIDGVHTSMCPPSACDGPGQLWVSAETAVGHSVELRLAERMYVGSLRIEWGAWGSTAFTVSSWNGSLWIDHLSGSVGSNGLVLAPIGVVTDRLRIAQPAGAGSGRPADGVVRPNLMSIGEVTLRGTPALLASSADSSYGGYSPAALIDGAVTASCAPSACDGPGELWVSAETPAEHWVELELGQWMYVGALRIDWGAWGSTAFTVRSWNGSAWVDHFGGSVGSNGLVEAPIGAYTDRLRIVQPAGAGAGRPADGFARPNLMSIGELTLWGYRGNARYVSAPIRMSDPIAQVTLTATQSGIGSGQSASYAISSDDGATWTAVTPGTPTTTLPPGDRLRWRVDLAGQGVGTPEIESVTLALTGQPREIAPALWRSGRSGAISAGVDDSQPTLLAPPLNQLNDAGFKGTSFVQGSSIPWYSLVHELASHTLSHGCGDSPPDGTQGNSLLAEFTQQQDIFDAALSERGRVQALAWPCGNYDLAKGSLAQRFFLSARGFRDGDPSQTPLCSPANAWNCAHPEGETMELVEEPTPRNFMNLKALAADHWRLPEFANAPDAIDWVENQGDWAVLAYHYFSDTGPYQGEIEAMVGRDVWVAPQGEVARYVKLRDSFASETVGSSATSRDFRVSTLLSPLDVPPLNHALASHPLDEVVERVFDGGVTARVHSPDPMVTPERALIWGNGAPLATGDETRSVEGNPYLLFDTPLTPYPTPIHVDWIAPGDADGDGVPNNDDNCVHRTNTDQSDIAGVALAASNLVGDRCECGDASNDGGVDAADAALLRLELTAPGSLGVDGLAKCSVIDLAAPTCDVADLVVLRRRLQAPPLLPGTFPVCAAARP